MPHLAPGHGGGNGYNTRDGPVDIAAIDARGVCVDACDVDDSLSSSTDTAAVNEGRVGTRELPRAGSVE